MRTRPATSLLLLLALASGAAEAKKVFLNPSNQTSNPVAGGGNEAQYALINANLAKPIIAAAGHSVTVDQDFYNAPKNANSWGADIFISIHTNAGGGHGIETLYVSSGGKVLSDHVQKGLLGKLPYQSRGLKLRTDLYVLNSTNMYACLTECLFHDCSTGSGYQGHPPAEAAFLRSSEGQRAIAAGIAAGACSYFGQSCGGAEPAPPAKGTLKGTVYRAPNLDDVIAGASVKLSNGQSLKTGENGKWSAELPPGKYKVTASAQGFVEASVEATVTEGKESWASIGLEPEEQPQPEAAPAAGDGLLFVWPDAGPARPAAPRPDEGCACLVAGGASPPVPLLLLAALLLALRARRRCPPHR